MELDDIDAAGALMETVDVLGDDGYGVGAASTLEVSDGDVGGVRLGVAELRAPSTVKAPDLGEAVRKIVAVGDPFDVAIVDAAFATEGGQPGGD